MYVYIHFTFYILQFRFTHLTAQSAHITFMDLCLHIFHIILIHILYQAHRPYNIHRCLHAYHITFTYKLYPLPSIWLLHCHVFWSNNCLFIAASNWQLAHQSDSRTAVANDWCYFLRWVGGPGPHGDSCAKIWKPAVLILCNQSRIITHVAFPCPWMAKLIDISCQGLGANLLYRNLHGSAKKFITKMKILHFLAS